MLFQFHITTDLIEQKQPFLQLCAEKNVKPVLIELEKGDYIKQPMFTQLVETENFSQALGQVQHTIKAFERAGFVIRRVKVEINPDENQDYLAEQNYYEWHCKVKPNQMLQLKTLCEQHHAHLSLNTLYSGERFITIRHTQKTTFYQWVQQMQTVLKQIGQPVIKEKFEYCIYDNFIELDKGWVS